MDGYLYISFLHSSFGRAVELWRNISFHLTYSIYMILCCAVGSVSTWVYLRNYTMETSDRRRRALRLVAVSGVTRLVRCAAPPLPTARARRGPRITAKRWSQEALSGVVKIEEALGESLTDKGQKEKIAELSERYNMLITLTERDGFLQGLRFGARLMAELMAENNWIYNEQRIGRIQASDPLFIIYQKKWMDRRNGGNESLLPLAPCKTILTVFV